MASGSNNTPVIAIVGPTGSGKTALALELARQFNGEIICADSRTVYKGMDIGTAKPSAEERRLVPHHLLDVVTPGQSFSVADFQRLAEVAIADISARGKIPFLVGGTGLYTDAVMYGFSLRTPSDSAARAALEKKTVAELQSLLRERNIALPQNDRNPRHLIRAIETDGQVPSRAPMRRGLILYLNKDREELKANIIARVEAMVKAGLIDEVRHLSEQYGWDAPGLQAPGYKTFRGYLEGSSTLNNAKAEIVQAHMQLAKRQHTWFKRNPDIKYICKEDEAVDLITTLMNN
jgi:tRNA dimethylallyltransferase